MLIVRIIDQFFLLADVDGQSFSEGNVVVFTAGKLVGSGAFSITEASLVINTPLTRIGDVANMGNLTKLIVDDNNRLITLNALTVELLGRIAAQLFDEPAYGFEGHFGSGYGMNGAGDALVMLITNMMKAQLGESVQIIGDVDQSGNSTSLTIDDGIQIIAFAAANGVTVNGVQVELVSRKDTDGTLAANSDSKYPSQKAVKTYVDQIVAANDAMVFKGVIDASSNPNYPAADRGHTYRISVTGKIGGGSGVNVEVGDIIICLDNGTSSGTQAAQGSHWTIAQANLDGAVIGPASATDNHIAQFDGTSGKLIKGGLSLDTDTALAANSDSRLASQKAVKTYADTKLGGTAAAGGDLSGNYPNPSVAKLGGVAVAVDTDGNLAANSDGKLASQKAVKTYVDIQIAGTISSVTGGDDIDAQTSGRMVTLGRVTKTGSRNYFIPDDQVGGAFTDGGCGANNQVSLFRVYLPFKLTVVSIHFKAGSVAGSGSIGLYNEDGSTLLMTSGVQDLSTNNIKSITLAAPVTLSPGFYLLAYTATSALSRIYCQLTDSTGTTVFNAGSVQRGSGANASSGGALPTTTGAITGATLPFPIVKFQG